MTFLELKNSVQRYIIDTNLSVIAEVDDVVNEALRRIEDNHNFKLFETKTGLLETTLITRKLADVPGDFKSLRNRPYLVDNDGNTIPIEWAPNDFEMDKQYEDLNTAIDKGQPTEDARGRTLARQTDGQQGPGRPPVSQGHRM